MGHPFDNRSRSGYGIGGIAFVVLLAFASPSRAEMIQFAADLKGSNQVPPNETRVRTH
jgi:hypothetical protein